MARVLQVCKHISETGSTNRDLLAQVIVARQRGQMLPTFYTLFASFQTAGRGQESHQWHSEAKQNILASTYFRPPLRAAQQFRFNQYFALSIRQFLLRYLPHVQIKWPNDIYVGDKKIAGILIEHGVTGENISYTIAGLGLNINQLNFPKELPNPTSLAIETGKSYELPLLEAELVRCLREHYGQLTDEESVNSLKTNYLSCLYRLGEYHNYYVRGEEVSACIVGVDDFGRLLLTSREGRSWCCGMSEVRFVI